MKRIIASLCIAIIAVVLCTKVYALYSVANEGLWPKTWPTELDPLRKQATTYVGPTIALQHYSIPFSDREAFEAAWPHLLQVKSKGAPILLVRGPSFFLGKKHLAGVIVHTPPEGQNKNPNTPEAPRPGVTDPRSKWMWTTYIELVVDGQIVDLNRIPLPADTPIVDERFPIESPR